MTNTLFLVQSILLSIASIAIIIAALGILNSMYTSVIERTKDIGIMKSIGATNKQIMMLFLLESIFIGLIASFFAIIFSLALSFIAKTIIQQRLGFFILYINPFIIIGGIIFTLIVSIISGLLPSLQASKLKPVDALRYSK